MMGTLSVIMAGIEAASKFAAAAADIAARLNRGELTEDQAREEWERTRSMYQAGAQAWDNAKR